MEQAIHNAALVLTPGQNEHGHNVILALSYLTCRYNRITGHELSHWSQLRHLWVCVFRL